MIANSFVEYMQDGENVRRIQNLMKELRIQAVQVSAEQNLAGKSFCITGSLDHYGSRNELKDVIEQRGGKVTGSVTSKTECLINNDIASNSSKNKKAKELEIPILTEEDFMAKYL